MTGDIDFLRQMITHHEAALTMATGLLANADADPFVRALATRIIGAQTAEIAEMRIMLLRLQVRDLK